MDRASIPAQPDTERLDPAMALADAVLTIDLAAIRANYRILKAKAAPARVAAVVKADAYGLGADRVAKALMREGCDTFFVAQTGEGIALRNALGIGATIFVLNGFAPGAEAAAAALHLFPVINSLAQLAAWSAQAKVTGQVLPAALQVDSGMNRLGMPTAEVSALCGDASLISGIDLRLVMSHLACADEPSHPANEVQRARFAQLRSKYPAVPSSLANSSGIFLGSDYVNDLVRPGAALYGINPTPAMTNPMRPVIGVSAKIVQVRDVPAGEGIGYGHAFVAPRAMRTATISIGYADGWHRRAAACGFWGGTRLPFVGRVSMDSIILDVSSLPSGTAAPGDLVELIGPHQSVDDVAGHAGTIGYEVLTGLGHRFHRIYTDDDRPRAKDSDI